MAKKIWVSQGSASGWEFPVIKCSSPPEGHSSQGEAVSQDGKEYPNWSRAILSQEKPGPQAKVRAGQEVRVLQLVRQRVTMGQGHRGSQSVTVGSSQERGYYWSEVPVGEGSQATKEIRA